MKCESTTSLKENFTIAKARYQPYINLTTQIYSIEELSSEEIIKEIKNAEIKSLYFRSENVSFSDEFAANIDKLIKAGVKEILVLCSKEKSQLSTKQLNHFLTKHKIHINFKIAQITQDELDKIRSDEIGKNNLLGFDDFGGYKFQHFNIKIFKNHYQLVYKNGAKIDLLNNAESDKIILANHADYRKFITTKHEFTLAEPEYITNNNNADTKSRVKELSELKKLSANLEIAKNIDLKIEVNKETEEENELDLDKNQEDNKFNKYQASDRVYVLDKLLFKESYLSNDNLEYVNLSGLVDKIFSSSSKIEFISSKALDLVVKNAHLFTIGINIENMPVGLAIKKGVLFATEQRLSSMPINEFTIKPNWLTAVVSDPLSYSWLKLASKASISLNDIYGSSIAPKITGKDVHPVTKFHGVSDIMLDIPYNYKFHHYKLGSSGELIYKDSIEINKKSEKPEHYLGIRFYNLTPDDKKRLEDIKGNLIQRGILDIFERIIQTSSINDGGFLLGDRAAVFLEKLFEDILPCTKSNKLNFFTQVLEHQKFKPNSSLEDVFEGLNGFYYMLQDFLLKLEIQDTASIENKAVEIIKNQLQVTSNYKVILGRLINIFELIINNGGNLQEQIEYLADNKYDAILTEPLTYLKAKEFGLNIIHQETRLNSEFNYPQNDNKFFEEDLINFIRGQQDFLYLDINFVNQVITNSIRYLSSIAPHQRASIDTYTKHFTILPNLDFHKNAGCNIRDSYFESESEKESKFTEEQLSLKTRDYVLADTVSYEYPIGYSAGEKASYVTFQPNLTAAITAANQLHSKYTIVAVIDNSIHLLYNLGIKGGLKLSNYDIDPNFVETFIKSWALVPEAQNALYKINARNAPKVDLYDHLNYWSLFIHRPQLIVAVASFLCNLLTEGDEDNSEHFFDSALSIKLEDNTYNIYYKDINNNQHRLNNNEIILPKALDEKITKWQQESKNYGTISLSDSEVKNTIFSDEKAQAHAKMLRRIVLDGKNNFDQTKQLLDNEPKEQVKDVCYASIGIIKNDVNLVTNFTTEQATRNTKLLVLNILSSSGRHYENQYPDQEFSSYISLFNLLFSEVKIYEDVQIGERHYVVKEDYNYNEIRINTKVESSSKLQEITLKEEQHQKLIDNFINVYKENPQFNFAQVVSIGLIANLDRSLTDDIIKNAKALLPYNSYFTQSLRVLISTDISDKYDLNELKDRAKLIANNIIKLNQNIECEGKQVKLHELLTQNGSNPENLVFFAALFAKDEEITANKIQNLLTKIANIDLSLKNQLLSSFAKSKLPFANGEIIASNFPKLSLSSLEDSEELTQIIILSQTDQINYEQATRFNDINLNSMENAKVDLSEIKSKYNLQIPQEYTYAQLKEGLIKDTNFIKEQFKTEINLDLDVIVSMFETITKHEGSYKSQIKKIAKLLYNPAKTLSEQYLEIDANKRSLDAILTKCSDQFEKNEILDILSAISPETLVKLLPFLRSLPQEKLHSKNYSALTLLEAAKVEIIDEYFEAFKIATEKFLYEDIGIELVELYELIGIISSAGYRSFLVKQIVEFALENKDYSIFTLLSKANGNTDHIEKIVDWICNISVDQIKSLNQTLGFNSKKWLEIKQIDKIEIIGEIALKLQNQLKPAQYKEVIEHIAKNDLSYAKLIQSYLVNYHIKNLPLDTRINLVMDNIDNLEALQSFFADSNLERFNYNKERVTNKISQIVLKNIESKLEQEECDKLQQNFANILVKASSYKDLNINEIHDKAISLKHARMLSKDSGLSEIVDIDLEFLSLSFELLYRQTGKFPRDVQIISNLNSLSRYESIIEEIATGQGKSIVTALFSAYLWFTGQTVDVVSSSQALAVRDLKEFSSFYDTLGIKHSNNIITADSFKDEYKKGGINYSTASDMALFRANREFYSNTHDVSLNADVSLVCDEVDSVLTSEINYKLATSMINTSQAETRVLFSYILEFVSSDIFKNNNLDRTDDIKNLELYLNYQFLKYDTSYKYPLNSIQMNDLNISDDKLANKLYLLHKALVKADQNKIKLFDKLLDAVIIAKSLEIGVDYVILKEDLDNSQELIKATPIIKDQPSKGTSFSDGVQAFLHLLIEEEMPHLRGRFDISAPFSTIFNLSPKNFFDYYRLTGGKVIGLTGTAGNIEEIEEFRTINKMLSFNIPRFEEDSRSITQEVATNKDEQIEKLLEIIQSVHSNKPIIVFAENTKSAEEVYNKLQNLRDHLQIYAASNLDTDSIENVVNKAGNDGYLTVTTPMLGRGTDFLTDNSEGFLAINLCTHITKITLWQIYGRVGRNGQKGEIVSLFNKEIFGEDIDKYMDSISLLEKEQRMQSQPLTDVLKFFNQVNHDNPINAIACNEFIRNAWNNLIENNIEGKSYYDLRDSLVEIVKTEYPVGSKKLEDYLKRVDAGTPATDALRSVPERSCYQANYVIQESKSSKLLFDQNDYIKNSQKDSYWPVTLGGSLSINKIQMPSSNGENIYRVLYNEIYKFQMAKLATHVFTIKDNGFTVINENYKLMGYVPWDYSPNHEINIFSQNNKLYYKLRNENPIEIKIGYLPQDGIPYDMYKNIVDKIKISNFKLDIEERKAINQYVIKNGYTEGIEFSAEGSGGDLMVDEFKKSFNAYKTRTESIEVNKLSPLIDNFMNIMELDLDKLEYGKYQAIHIVTKFDSTSSHVESFVTDGNVLFWINRGGDTTGDGPGIKVFKIIRDIEYVKDALKWLQVEKKSQVETRSKIYTMLREDDDQNIPVHVLIPMQAQSIGNCGWTQTKAILKAAAIINKIGNLTELPDIESQEWQKAIKDADDIYKDFVNYDIAKRLEAIVFTINPEFKPVFLDIQEQEEINSRRDVLENPITDELLEKVHHLFNEKDDKFLNTIYEKQVTHLRDLISLEVAFNSNFGRALQRIDGEEKAKLELQLYQNNKIHDFGQLSSIYSAIEKSRIDFAPIQDQLFKQITNYLTDINYNIAKIHDFNDILGAAVKECLNECRAECVMTKIENQIIEETQEICLAQIPILMGMDYTY